MYLVWSLTLSSVRIRDLFIYDTFEEHMCTLSKWSSTAFGLRLWWISPKKIGKWILIEIKMTHKKIIATLMNIYLSHLIDYKLTHHVQISIKCCGWHKIVISLRMSSMQATNMKDLLSVSCCSDLERACLPSISSMIDVQKLSSHCISQENVMAITFRLIC